MIFRIKILGSVLFLLTLVLTANACKTGAVADLKDAASIQDPVGVAGKGNTSPREVTVRTNEFS